MSEERPPQPDPNEQPGPAEQPQPVPVETPPPQEAPPAAEERDWRDRRIGEQQQRLRDRNARIQELEAQLAQYQQGNPTNPQIQNQFGQQPGQFTSPNNPGDIQRQINEAAAAMASAQEFTRRCNEVAEAGRKSYQNFDQRVQRLTGLVDANDTVQVNQYNSFLSACMETGQASRIIYELGGDLNEASRIMAMQPIQMAVELTKMSIRPGSEASQAPRPLNPVATAAQNMRQSAAPDDPDTADALSKEEWFRRRDEQVASRRQRTLG